jgi:hypothetical protein
MNLRPVFAPLQLDGTPAQHVSKKVTVRHPGYEGRNNILTTLLAADGPHGGLDLATVHTICAILADNRFDGYLGCEPNPTSPALHLHILPPGEYFFHVPFNTEASASRQATVEHSSIAHCYPVVAFFDSWCRSSDSLAALEIRHNLCLTTHEYYGGRARSHMPLDEPATWLRIGTRGA